MRLANRIRLLFGRPFKPESQGGGLTLTDVPNQGWWDRRPEPEPRCQLCNRPATNYKRTPPWPGTTYSHVTYTCDDHDSYLDGHSWTRAGDGEWRDNGPTQGRCTTCHASYGSCEHTAHYAAMARAQEAGAIRGRL